MAEADVVRRLKASAGVATLAVAMPGEMLNSLALGLVTANRGFDKTIDGVRYAGQVFDRGRFYGLTAIKGEDSHAVAVTRAQIGELGASAAISEAIEDLRAWVAANV